MSRFLGKVRYRTEAPCAMVHATRRRKRDFKSVPDDPGHCSFLAAPTQAQLDRSGKELNMERLSHGLLSKTRLVLGRSFFPLFAIVVIAGTMLWGPWVSLAATVLAVAAALRLI
jgi:hypothetical protein